MRNIHFEDKNAYAAYLKNLEKKNYKNVSIEGQLGGRVFKTFGKKVDGKTRFFQGFLVVLATFFSLGIAALTSKKISDLWEQAFTGKKLIQVSYPSTLDEKVKGVFKDSSSRSIGTSKNSTISTADLPVNSQSTTPETTLHSSRSFRMNPLQEGEADLFFPKKLPNESLEEYRKRSRLHTVQGEDNLQYLFRTLDGERLLALTDNQIRSLHFTNLFKYLDDEKIKGRLREIFPLSPNDPLNPENEINRESMRRLQLISGKTLNKILSFFDKERFNLLSQQQLREINFDPSILKEPFYPLFIPEEGNLAEKRKASRLKELTTDQQIALIRGSPPLFDYLEDEVLEKIDMAKVLSGESDWKKERTVKAFFLAGEVEDSKRRIALIPRGALQEMIPYISQETFHLIPTEKLREVDFANQVPEKIYPLFKPLFVDGERKASRLKELTPEQQQILIKSDPDLQTFLPVEVEKPSPQQELQPPIPPQVPKEKPLPNLDQLNLLDKEIYEYPDKELLKSWDPSKRKAILQGDIAKGMIAKAKEKIGKAEKEEEKKAIFKDLFRLQALKNSETGEILLISNFEKAVLVQKSEYFKGFFEGYFRERSQDLVEIEGLDYLDQFLSHWGDFSQLPRDDEFNQLQVAEDWNFTDIGEEIKKRLKYKFHEALINGDFEVVREVFNFFESTPIFPDFLEQIKKDFFIDVENRIRIGEFHFIKVLESEDLIKDLPNLEIDFSMTFRQLSPEILPFLKKLPIASLKLGARHIKQFQDPRWLENFKQIKHLDIADSNPGQLTDEDLGSLTQCSHLNDLRLFSCNQLKGTFCQIGDLKNLKKLEIVKCPCIQESFFSGLKELKLEAFHLKEIGYLTHDLVEQLQGMPLSELWLRDCQPPLVGSSLKMIQGLASLEILNLNGSFAFTEETLQYIQHPHLKTLGLSYSDSLQNGVLVTHIKTHLPKLTELYFGNREYSEDQLKMIREGKRDL